MHVYSCTTDNGKNMLKCVRELSNSQQMALDSGTELNIEEMFCIDELENEETEDTNAIVDREMNEMLDAVGNILLHGNESCITTLKCAAHTVNLVVKDVVNPDDEILKKIRKIVKICRRTEYKPSS